MNNSEARRKVQQAFLLTFFKNGSGYKEIMLNGYWLVKSQNGDTGNWQVAIMTPEAHAKMQTYKQQILFKE